jgi:nickel-type superoxide dismutase maturation protease
VPAAQLLLWWLGRRERFVVRGDSMEPSLEDGDEVLVNPRAFARRRPDVGDVVLFVHPIQSDVRAIKRVAEVRESGLWLLGDNPPSSSDSRTYGVVPDRKLLGRVERILPEG